MSALPLRRKLWEDNGWPRCWESICVTSIRVSKVNVRAAEQRQSEINLTGKIRIILLPSKLRWILLRRTRKDCIASTLRRSAGVEFSKAFYSNLRHLFIRAFYREYQDIA